MLLDFKNGQTSVVLRLKIRDSSKTTGAGLTGLTYSSSGLIISTIADNEATATVYTAAATHIQTIATLGTFAAPSASNCRFAEVDSTNHKGVYEIQIADARFAVSGAKSLLISISGATNCVETEVMIPLRAVDPFSANAFMTGVNSLAPPTNWNLESIDGSGRVDVGKWLGNAVTVDTNNAPNVNAKYFGATAVTGRDLGLSVLLSSGTGTGQLSITAGILADTAGTGTLLTRVSSARAGYIDNLNVGGNVASHADITGLDTASPLAQLSVSSVFQKPGSSTESYQILLITRAMGTGLLTDIDSGVGGITSVVTNAASTDRSANLGTWTHVSTGIYSNTYSVAYNAANESLMMRFSGAIGGNAFVAPATPIVADYSEFNATYASYLTALYNVMPAYTPLVDSAGKLTLSATQSFNNTGQTTKYAATLAASDVSGTIPVNATQWGSVAVTGMPMPTYTQPTGFLAQTFPGGILANQTNITAGTITNVTNLTNAATNGDFTAAMKTSTTTAATAATPTATLPSSGLDSIVVESGMNARQALSIIASALSGVLSGAGTGTITVKGGNVATTRIVANTDNAGNRTSVALSLPT